MALGSAQNLGGPTLGASPAWRQLSTATSPPDDLSVPMAFDPAAGETIMLSTTTCHHTYTWAFKGGAWANISSHVSGSPPARTGASMVFDARDGYLLIYGGQKACGAGGYLQDTWAFSNNSWVKLNIINPPGPITDYGLAYDAYDRYVVMYGGYRVNGTLRGPVTTTFAYAAGNWTLLHPANHPRPLYDLSMAGTLSGARGVLLFGGLSATSYHNDTWTFRGGTWSHVQPRLSPPPRAYGVLAYDARLSSFVFFGGVGANNAGTNDTWTFSNGSWTDITPTVGAAPPADFTAPKFTISVGCYVPGAGRVLLFDGSNQTWALQ